MRTGTAANYIRWFEDLGSGEVASVGGKNASLGELVRKLAPCGIKVPPGFAITAEGYWHFIDANSLRPWITERLAKLKEGKLTVAEVGKSVRVAIEKSEWPEDLAKPIRQAYRDLSQRLGVDQPDVAVRSSATAEDLPEASFAGQHESFLNVSGEAALLDACRRCYASLFSDRAISYREAKGFDHLRVALSVGVQQMVRSDLAGAGVAFSIDTETGFDRVVLINAAWGLGENVVQGAVDPDEYQVFKPLLAEPALKPIVHKRCGGKAIKMVYTGVKGEPTRNIETTLAERSAFVLTDAEILDLAHSICAIEQHYGRPMDVEWAKDGRSGEVLIVQARPETVQSRAAGGLQRTYKIMRKGRTLASGLSIGAEIVSGPVCIIRDPKNIDRFVSGSVLVTTTTNPDWVPIMRRAAAIVTDRGGRTSHAAIVSRELGLPAVVGTGDATKVLQSEQYVTVSCAEGDEGFVYDGIAEVVTEEIDVTAVPVTKTKIMLNLANPAAAFRWWRLPADGVGLARMEFVIANHVRVHPMALVHFDRLTDGKAMAAIDELTRGYEQKPDYFVDRLSLGLARIAAAFYPKPAIIRMSDFKTNEYAGLLGGTDFEPKEENPMIGFRGASRYYSPQYRDGFALECRAIRRLREEMGFANVVVMIPFCRSPEEADRVLEVMAENGLVRGENGLEVYVMCEIPSNVILASAFAERFDGFSIGSNDLTQLTLGVDRDSELLADLFDEENEAVKWMIRNVIEQAHKAGAKVGLCGQAPSNRPDFAEFLVACGIDSISVTPDSFIAVKQHVASAESNLS
ncbi:MAG: phosphoenolpyruvate synthase [Methyloceanibacter sp.]